MILKSATYLDISNKTKKKIMQVPQYFKIGKSVESEPKDINIAVIHSDSSRLSCYIAKTYRYVYYLAC